MPNCTVSETQVMWTIDKETINKEFHQGLLKENVEYAGVLSFHDHSCTNGLCNKMIHSIDKDRGDAGSVRTPNGYVNYHTHPKSCYITEETKWGWPSGEDMGMCLLFAKNKNLIHIVFTVEGTYVIKVKNIPNKNTWKYIEEILKETHVFRSIGNNKKISAEFRKGMLSPAGISNTTENRVSQWLYLVNSITLDNTKELYKKLYSKNINISGSDKIFEVNFYS